MKPAEVERLLLSSLKTPAHLYTLKQKHNLEEAVFAFYQEEARYIFKYLRDYGTPPPKELIEAQFEDFEYSPSDAFESLAADMRKVYMTRMVHVTYGNVAKYVDDNPTEAINMLSATLTQLAKPTEVEMVEISVNPLSRFDAYMDRVQKSKDEGFLQMGIEPIDPYVFLSPGQIVGIVAATGVGKSFVSAHIAASMYLQGKKVLFLSPELSRVEASTRFDVCLAKLMGYEFSYQALLWGLDTSASQYKEYLTKLEESKEEDAEIFLYDSTLEDEMTASFIQSLLTKHKPDVMFIDSINFISDETPGSRQWQQWQQIGNVMRSLKYLAGNYETTIFITSQQNTDGEVAYSKDVARYCDVLLQLSNLDDNEEGSTTRRRIAVTKNRSGSPVNPSLILYDADAGAIGAGVF